MEHFQDESNFQNDYLRNRVRNLYIPNLETENPKFAKALVDLADEVTLANKVIYDILDTVDITNIHDFRGSGSLQRSRVWQFTKVLVAVLFGRIP